MNIILLFRRLIAVPGTVLILVLSCGWATAQNFSDAHLKAAYRAIAAIHVTDEFDAFLPRVAYELKNELTGRDPNYAQVIAEVVDEQAMQQTKRRGDLEGEAARVYAKSFTQDELNQIATFYESETGKKLLLQSSAVMGDVMSIYSAWRERLSQDLVRNVSDVLLKKFSDSEKKPNVVVNPAVPDKSKK